jgi:hypothetical protein
VKYDCSEKELWVENIRGELINEIKSMFISKNDEVVIADGFMSKEMTFGDIIVKNESPLIEWIFHSFTFYFWNIHCTIKSRKSNCLSKIGKTITKALNFKKIN